MAGVAQIFVSGIIGDDFFDFADEMGTTLADVRRQFDSFDSPDSVTVHINSPGGDVWEGFAIHDYLINLGLPIRTIGEGKVFSIATVILQAGDKGSREMTPNATFMIHNPLAGQMGNAEDLEKVAEELRAIETRLANFYAIKTGQEITLLRDMMDAETFLTAEDAQRLGFIDTIREPVKAVAYFGKRDEEAINNTSDMSKQEEVKEARDLLTQIKALFAKNEKAEVAEPEAPEAAQPEAGEQNSDELAELKAQMQAMQSRFDELAAAKEAAETAKVEAEAKVEEQAAVIAQIQQKVVALEAMPIISGDPNKAVPKSAMEKPEPHKLDNVAAYFRAKYGQA